MPRISKELRIKIEKLYYTKTYVEVAISLGLNPRQVKKCIDRHGFQKSAMSKLKHLRQNAESTNRKIRLKRIMERLRSPTPCYRTIHKKKEWIRSLKPGETDTGHFERKEDLDSMKTLIYRFNKKFTTNSYIVRAKYDRIGMNVTIYTDGRN